MPETVGSFCSGYGGLDLAVERYFGAVLGWWSDIEPAAIATMQHHWPGVPNLGDLTAITDWSTVPRVDILTAGYPCQPFSAAGKRKGENDSRHLWPYIAEAIRGLRPRVVVLENVAGHRSKGLDKVVYDLAETGYRVAWGSVRASDVGAAHRRERVFIVATSDSDSSGLEIERVEPARQECASAERGRSPFVPNASDLGHERGGTAWERGGRTYEPLSRLYSRRPGRRTERRADRISAARRATRCCRRWSTG